MSKQHEILFYHMLIYEEIAKQTFEYQYYEYTV